MLSVLLTGIYDFYKTPEKGYGIYGNLDLQTEGVSVGIFHILQNVAVYSGVIALLLAAAYLAISARDSAKGLQEAKSWILRILILSVLIFAVSGLVVLFQRIGLDA